MKYLTFSAGQTFVNETDGLLISILDILNDETVFIMSELKSYESELYVHTTKHMTLSPDIWKELVASK